MLSGIKVVLPKWAEPSFPRDLCSHNHTRSVLSSLFQRKPSLKVPPRLTVSILASAINKPCELGQIGNLSLAFGFLGPKMTLLN